MPLRIRLGFLNYAVLPVAEEHFAALHDALDQVAREKRFLAFTQAPPLEETLAFLQRIVASDHCHFVALAGERVVGWCDVLPTHGEARSHIGHLGIGLVASARHQGVGARLLEAALARSREIGFTRIELSVRVDNSNAKALYERFGFTVEARQERAIRVDGQYHAAYAMALLV